MPIDPSNTRSNNQKKPSGAAPTKGVAGGGASPKPPLKTYTKTIQRAPGGGGGSRPAPPPPNRGGGGKPLLRMAPQAAIGPFNRGQMPLAEGDRFANRPTSMLPVSSWGEQPPPPPKRPGIIETLHQGWETGSNNFERAMADFLRQLGQGLDEYDRENDPSVPWSPR
jgi:hypothetical protein